MPSVLASPMTARPSCDRALRPIRFRAPQNAACGRRIAVVKGLLFKPRAPHGVYFIGRDARPCVSTRKNVAFCNFPERTPCDLVPQSCDSAICGVGLQKVGFKKWAGIARRHRKSGTKERPIKIQYHNVTPSGFIFVLFEPFYNHITATRLRFGLILFYLSRNSLNR